MSPLWQMAAYLGIPLVAAALAAHASESTDGVIDQLRQRVRPEQIPESYGATFLAVLKQDAEDWPDGHPCRDCGQLAKDHPVVGVLECRDWR